MKRLANSVLADSRRPARVLTLWQFRYGPNSPEETFHLSGYPVEKAFEKIAVVSKQPCRVARLDQLRAPGNSFVARLHDEAQQSISPYLSPIVRTR